MTVKQTQITELYTSWGDPFDKAKLRDLNRDLKQMQAGIEFHVEEDEDGFTLRFIRRTED